MTMNSLKIDMWADILEVIEEFPQDNLTGIQQKTKCTYSHLVDIIQLLKDHKLITTSKRGRTTIVDITKTGRKLVASVRIIKEIIGGQQNE